MSQALRINVPHIRWDHAPRKPFEPLLAEVVATVSDLEAAAGPQRLTTLEAVEDICDLSERLSTMVFDSRRGATKDDLRMEAMTLIVAGFRFIRDVCGDNN